MLQITLPGSLQFLAFGVCKNSKKILGGWEYKWVFLIFAMLFTEEHPSSLKLNEANGDVNLAHS